MPLSHHYFPPPENHLNFVLPTVEDYSLPSDSFTGMAMAMAISKRKRKSAPKTKSGCATCKERHVKCGEERPSCLRCQSAGRECGGYGGVAQKKPRLSSKPTQITPRPMLPTPMTTATCTLSPTLSDLVGIRDGFEMQQLDYFYTKASASLAGPMNVGLWNDVFSRASRTEPCIRYAMIAVSSMHRHFLSAASMRRSRDEALRKPSVTLRYYNKSIAALNNRIAESFSSIGATLMCCILFTCLETIQGNAQGFVAHVRNGQNLIPQWRAKQAEQSSTGEALSFKVENDMIEQFVVPYMAQLDALANSFQSQDAEAATLMGTEIESSHGSQIVLTSLLDAQRRFGDMKEVIITFARFTSGFKYSDTWGFNEIANLCNLQVELRTWRRAFNDLLFRMQPTLDASKDQLASATLLEIQYHAVATWLATAHIPEQCAYDEHFEAFLTLVNLRSIGAEPHADIEDTIFGLNVLPSFNPIPQLVFVAILCRDPQVRGLAIGLLRGSISNESSIRQAPPSLIGLREHWWDVEASSAASSTLTTPSPFTGCRSPAVDPALLEVDQSALGMPSDDGQMHFSRWVDDYEADPSAQSMDYYSKSWDLQGQWLAQQAQLHV